MSKESGRGCPNVLPGLTSLLSQIHTSNYLLHISIWMFLRQLQLTTKWNSLTLTQHQLLFLCIQLKKWHHHPHGHQSQKSGSHPRLALCLSVSLASFHTLHSQWVPVSISTVLSQGRSLTLLPAQFLPLPSIPTLLPECFFLYANKYRYISSHALT